MLGRFSQGDIALTERLTTTPPGIALGPLDQIADGAARNFVIEMRAGRFHGFVVRRGAEAFGYVDRCPHMGLPLAQTLDDYVAGGMIACSWHGAVFDITSGKCLGGPCPGTALTPWPVVIRDETILTA
ncbi:MAG: Rieske (2Fe-2S) protein [Candidatus Sphingomonas colombiensis]|nr:Rieske (2Fe-2S) protein [Sphingomonas sp.]WEK43685.1 MAG: Rieske (2Fe-2S) protein [Sphingomonas sp.]